MKEFRVVLYINGEKQWISVWSDNKDQAKKKALESIMVLSIEEM
jgi:hypothetical protein